MVAVFNGTYTVRVGNNNQCLSEPSDPVQVIYDPGETPTITAVADTLISSAEVGNQWLFNGFEIPGATEQIYIADSTGSYRVFSTIDDCASLPSDPYQYVVTSIDNVFQNNYFDVYPNPFYNSFFVEARTQEPFTDFELRVLDLSGRAVFEGSLLNEVNLPDLLSGVYFILIEKQGQVIHKSRIVKI